MFSLRSICLLIVFLFSLGAVAQESRGFFEHLSTEAGFHYGYFITTVPKARYLRETYASFGELGLCWESGNHIKRGTKNRTIRSGISLLYGNPGSTHYIGKAVAVFPYTHISLLRFHKVHTTIKVGGGLGWIEKPYDVINNHKNTLIGSHINACIALGLRNEISISKQWYLNGGLSFTHFSNGTITLPNLGLNIPSFTLGLRYQLSKTIKEQPIILDSFIKKKKYSINFSAGIKQRPWIGSNRYVITNVQAEAAQSINPAGEYGAGLLLGYDPASRKEIEGGLEQVFDERASKWQAGVYAFYTYKTGRISMPLQAGVYVYNNYAPSTFFQNIGMAYHVNKHWAIRTLLKTHLGRADFIHLGVGYTF